ncbi:rap guanine nucleotide exchange factor 5 isoform X2 [Stegostoma tigrinum]|uniref:rap guanine nucleotide exchange factor 5 isoform X2 n=1 Tax=Stegostoma tigrinum TaxID=3053191 RepID=UPI00202B291D|nr:rap guanine nucleotide exchange factor 5 isoform X2 [Stegostoma tigrinum]
MAQRTDIPGSFCVPEVGLLAAIKWSRNVKGQGQLKQKIKDLPALLKNGLNLKKKQADVQVDTLEQNDDNHPSNSRRKIYSEIICCAGKALRKNFLKQAPHLVKDRVTTRGKCMTCCVGFEMVDWLLDQCPFIYTRTKAEGIWQILLDLGILSSVMENQENFQDKDIIYQFSNDEYDDLACPFRMEGEWKNGVRLLSHIVPYVQSRTNLQVISEQSPAEEKIASRDEILQIQGLALLSTTVNKELVAAIAARGEAPSCGEQNKPVELKGSVNNIRQNKNDEVNTVRVKERGQDVLILKKMSSSSPAPTAGSAQTDGRYTVVAGTPEKILEHLLEGMRLEEGECEGADTLLDDFLLTYTVFMSTNDLCHALLRHYCSKTFTEKQEGSDNSLYRKRKVLRIVSQWVYLYRTLLREDENTKLVFKNLYRCVLDDLYEYPSLEKGLKELQSLFWIPRRHTIDEYSPHKKNTTNFHQFSCREKWLQPKAYQAEEVYCRVYVADHSYVSFRTKMSTSAQQVLHIVAEKLQQSDEDLMLMAVTSTDERQILQPDDVSLFTSLDSTTRIFVCKKDPTDILTLTAENDEILQRTIQILGMNTWQLANKLTNFDWDLFNCICEQELIYYTFHRRNTTANLDFLLQRCNEVQLWVATEVLLCSQLSKRVQLVKKFVKVAAHCRALRNLNSSFAIIMGLNSAAICRLSQTWEKVPGKFKKLFSELESFTDPSLNHKAYRDAFKKMQPPKIPFMPLLLKDVTFIHEGNKTFLDNLVNFEKLHMIADSIRLLRHCRSNQISMEDNQKDHQDVKAYVHYLHVIESQETLFQLSHRLEPRS